MGIWICIVSVSASLAQPVLTTNGGVPVGDNQNSKTLGNDGPVLLEDIYLIEKLAAFDRERIPERVVHARGAGAFGEFVAERGFSEYTKASVFSSAGKKTKVFVRFSTVIHGNGSPETVRDPRGFAVKFYTDQGNYDIVGNNLPVFFIRDAIKFPDMVHSLKPSPIYNKQDPARFFDFFANIPESTHMLMRLYSDFGIPASYREMNGSGVHAFKWINAEGKIRYVKYTWKTLQGEKNLTVEEAAVIQGKDFQHATTDLYQHIRKGNFPSWELYVQIMEPEVMETLDFHPLDATKIWPEDKLPLIKVGKMTLNQVPDNFFEDVEQAAFSPGNLVPGIEASEDKLLQGRLFSYFDTQRYRIGANFQQVDVNAPLVKIYNHNQDGALGNRNEKSDINYQPSVANPGEAYVDKSSFEYAQTVYKNTRTMQEKISRSSNFTQAGEFYRSLSEKDKTHLLNNLYGDLSQVENRKVKAIITGHFYLADSNLGKALAEKLGLNREEVEKAISGQ